MNGFSFWRVTSHSESFAIRGVTTFRSTGRLGGAFRVGTPRRIWRELWRRVDAELWPEPALVENQPNDAIRDLAGCLQPLVAQLPQIYGDALDRVDLAGQTHHAAAAEVGISTSGMKSRVQRGRRQLRELLTDCCTVEVDRLGSVVSYHPNSGTCGCAGDE